LSYTIKRLTIYLFVLKAKGGENHESEEYLEYIPEGE
jgi:hypothetical protein